MANNRIGIVCNVCGEKLPLAKSMGEGFYISPAFNLDALSEFLDEHTFCTGKGDIGDEGDFSLEYEFPIRDDYKGQVVEP